MIDYREKIEKIKEKYGVDLSNDVYIGLGTASCMIEISHGEDSDYYPDERSLINDIVNGVSDISWSCFDRYDKIPSEVAETLLHLFEDIEYYILDIPTEGLDINGGKIIKGILPEGLEYELIKSYALTKQYFFDNKVEWYKLCDFNGNLMVIYSTNKDADKILQIIETYN